MNLADIYKSVRGFLRRQREADPEVDREAWEKDGVNEAMRLTKVHGLVEMVLFQFWSGAVQTIAANIVQPPGAAPRANPDQMVVWAELQPLPGLAALRSYFKRTRKTHDRHELVGRILASVSATFGSDEQAMAEYENLAVLAEAAGVEARDVDALREMHTGTDG